MFVVNSRLGLSSVAFNCFLCMRVHNQWPSFSRSYGCILPSSLTRVFPRTLGFSPRLPVSVCGTGTSNLARSFSRQRGSFDFSLAEASDTHHSSGFQETDLPISHPTSLDILFHQYARTSFCVTPSLKQLLVVLEFSPVVHRLRSLPRLRSRLTLSRRSLLRKP